ncbi:MAG: cation:proton antiporter [Rickettsiaceae bacterium]|nr:cation:proton antiporter [Rickettsiaceae bacterium]MDP4832162.1 cation:proton antiporter [Rickettsiaceae bacterium]MDP5020358.1 cation:proton antiporter [Rickettsiaceae bacterium]MDP5082850.1 cation:proton antiporter [Rickettsiaceae bacterium]
MIQFISPQFLVISTLLIGVLNLITPFASKEDTNFRSFLMLTVSILFLTSILSLDWLFLSGAKTNFTALNLGKYSIALHIEPLGLIFLTLLGILWICAILYTIKFLEINQMKDSNRFLFFMNCCIIIGSIVALSANLFTMFVGYEVLTLCTIPLIAHQGGEKVAKGLFQYLKILMLSGLVLFLPAIIIIYTHVGHGNFTSGGFIAGYFSDTYAIILLLMFIFGIAKAAIYPLHSWLPAAMVASYPVSALLHAAVVVKTGLFCIYKVLIYVFGLAYLQLLFADYNWLVFLPIITILYSSIQAIRYTQVKMMLAYSTINQLSIALMSAFLLSQKGMTAAVMHMISHSFTKICIFYAAGNIYSVKNSYHIGELIGIRSTMPKTSFVMLIAGLSLMGIPPFAGFISKFYIILAAAEQENILVMITLGISTLFSALYVIKMLIFIYRPTSENFILHLKLKPYFDENLQNKSSKRIISSRHKAEKRLPMFMILSIALCMSGVVGFFLIQHGINKFLMFI